MLTEIELQNKIDSAISKLEKCNENVVNNVLKQYNCNSINDLKVMLENTKFKVLTGITGLIGTAAIGVGSAAWAQGMQTNRPVLSFLGGFTIGTGIRLLYQLLMYIRAERRIRARYKNIKQSGNMQKSNEINQKLNTIQSKISKTKENLKQIVSKLPPEKKAKFLKKAEKIKAKFK